MYWNLGRARAGASQSAGCVGSAAMAAPIKKGFRLVSDYRAVNKQIEKVSGVMPNQGAEMADMGGDMFWEALHAARILANVAGGRSPGSVHHRHSRRCIYPHACAPSRFERDGLLPRCDDRVLAGLNCRVWVDDIGWWGG